VCCDPSHGVNWGLGEAVEEIWQEAVRILKGSCNPKNNQFSVKMKSLWSLETKAELMVLLSDKGYMTVVLDTVDYNRCPPLGLGLQEVDQGSH
jgi:hypothetical protein